MFREWNFLLAEIWGLLLLAALVGLVAGWLLRGRGRAVPTAQPVTDPPPVRVEPDAELTQAKARISLLETTLAATRDELASCKAARISRPAADPGLTVPGIPVAPASPPPAALMATRPSALPSARNGRPDDLTLIKGIGPKLAVLCNRLGFYHFDQIAAWTPAELAWVDDNLEGFRGRATRDNWIGQARDLAAGKPPLPDSEH